MVGEGTFLDDGHGEGTRKEHTQKRDLIVDLVRFQNPCRVTKSLMELWSTPGCQSLRLVNGVYVNETFRLREETIGVRLFTFTLYVTIK